MGKTLLHVATPECSSQATIVYYGLYRGRQRIKNGALHIPVGWGRVPKPKQMQLLLSQVSDLLTIILTYLLISHDIDEC